MDETTLLIVDDDEAIIESLSMRFEDRYRVFTAINVDDAVEKLTAHGHEVDVVILDLTMPLTVTQRDLKKDAGMEVFWAARGRGLHHPLAPQSQFVALTANRDVDMQHLTFLGMGTVIKGAPLYLEALDEWIRKAGEHRAARTAAEAVLSAPTAPSVPGVVPTLTLLNASDEAPEAEAPSESVVDENAILRKALLDIRNLIDTALGQI